MLAAGAVALVGCGDDGGSSGSSGSEENVGGVDLSGKDFVDSTGQATVEVSAVDNNFKDPYIEISAGTKVVFTNDGRNQHNVLPVVDDAFPAIEVADFEPGETGEVTFDEPGDFPYYCSLHGTTTKGMVGAIRVVEADGAG